MDSDTARGHAANPPITITSDEESATDNSSDFETKLSNRACDREEAEAAFKKAVAKAKSNLESFRKQAKKEEDLDRISRALKKREKNVKKEGKEARKAIKRQGEGSASADESVPGKKMEKKPFNQDQLFAAAANKVAKVVLEAMVADGVADGPVIDTLNALDEDPPPTAHISHEEQLVAACVPEQLRSAGFAEVDLEFPSIDPNEDGWTHVTKAIRDGLAAINAKVEHVMRVQQIHTLAHLSNIRATGLLRAYCLNDGSRRDKVQSSLLISMKSVILGSDPELADLPFRALAKVEIFFMDINRIVKLAHFLLAFVEYDRHYVARLLDTVFHIQLQRSIYWKSGTGNNG